MQTVWFLLAQSGLVPATLLKITPPRFLRPGQKAVSEIRLSLESFPRITLPSPETLEIAATYLRKEKLEAEREELVREFSGLTDDRPEPGPDEGHGDRPGRRPV